MSKRRSHLNYWSDYIRSYSPIMRFPWNTTSGLMALTACSAVVLAAHLASDLGSGSLSLGLILIGTASVGVAAIRVSESIRLRRADGVPMTVGLRATIILRSAGVAALIVGLADFSFLLAYALLAGGTPLFSFPPTVLHSYLVPPGVMAGCLAGLSVCYLARRAFWCPVPKRGRPIRLVAPFAVVALLWGADLTLGRIAHRRERAAYHDVLASQEGGETTLPIPLPPLPGYHRRPELAAYHVRMRRKWERAAACPWLPVEADPPPPE